MAEYIPYDEREFIPAPKERICACGAALPPRKPRKGTYQQDYTYCVDCSRARMNDRSLNSYHLRLSRARPRTRNPMPFLGLDYVQRKLAGTIRHLQEKDLKW